MTSLVNRATSKVRRLAKNPKNWRAELAFLRDGLVPIQQDTDIVCPIGMNWEYKSELPVAILWGFAKWKKEFMASFLPDYKVIFIVGRPRIESIRAQLDALIGSNEATYFRWGRQTIPQGVSNYVKTSKEPLITVEDGFLRSFNPGAFHTPPYSLVFDKSGIYYNARKTSDIEALLAQGPLSIDDPLKEQAEAGIAMMNAGYLTKYYPLTVDSSDALTDFLERDEKYVLVIGQVEKDASLRYGRKSLSRKSKNSTAIMYARQKFPEHQILYRPHPDEMRNRKAPKLSSAAQRLCKVLPQNIPLEAALDAVETIVCRTSLVGLEAQIKGHQSTVLELPFYAGWNVTEDVQTLSRRKETLDLPTLFARTYLDYPRYVHPAGDTQCSFFDVAGYFMVERVKFDNLLDIPKHLIDVDALKQINPRYLPAPLVLIIYLQGTESVGSADIASIMKIAKHQFKIEDFEQFSQILIQSANYDSLVEYCRHCAEYFRQNWASIQYNPKLIGSFFAAYARAQKNSNGRILAPLMDVSERLAELCATYAQYCQVLPAYITVLSNELNYDTIERLQNNLSVNAEVPYGIVHKIASVLGGKPTRSERNSAKRHKLLQKSATEYVNKVNQTFPSHWDLCLNLAMQAVILKDTEAVKKAYSRLVEQFKASEFSLQNPRFNGWGNLRKRLPHFYTIYNYLIKQGEYKFATEILNKHFYPKGVALSVPHTMMQQRLQLLKETATGNHEKTLHLYSCAHPAVQKEEKQLVSYARSLRAIGAFEKSLSIFKTLKSTVKTPDKKIAIKAEIDKLEFIIEASAILNAHPQPKLPKGVIILASQTCYNTLAMMAPALSTLKKNGYAVVNLMEGMTKYDPTGLPYVDQFADCLSTTLYSHELTHSWEVDWDKRVVKAAGVNFYQGFYERLSTACRNFFVDINQPALWKDFMVQVKRSDKCLNICERIYNDLVERGLNVAIISGNSHVTPFSVFRDFCRHKDDPRLTFINSNVAYESYYSNLGSKFSNTMCVTDMTLHPNRRAPFMALPHKFERWYKENKNNAEFKKRADDMIKVNRNQSSANPNLIDFLETQKKLGKKIICCFGKVPVDLNVPYDGGPAHQDMSDWITHTVDICGDTEDIVLLVKPHPHELRPEIALDLVSNFESLIRTEKKPNIKVLGHKDINTHALAPYLDMAILYNGSSSMELTALGVPVMMCAYFGLHDYPVNLIYPKNRKQYEQYIKAGKYKKPTQEIRKRAAFLISYMGTPDVSILNRYATRQVTNDKVGFPKWRKELVEHFLENGDPSMDLIAARIVEKFEGEPDETEYFNSLA